MAQQYGRYSSFRDPQGMSERTARERAGALEQRAQAPDELAVRATYLDLLAIAAGERVLDVGCGSGVVLRDLARRVAPTGVAVGVDPSPLYLDYGRGMVPTRTRQADGPWVLGDRKTAQVVVSVAH